jgi:formate dehydrogenase major subunit
MVNITIDGKQLEVPEGVTVLQAARLGGIEIPTLCDHPQLPPYGGCRMCLVEVEGMRTMQTSCTLPVSNNMVVRTDSAAINEARKFVLTMIFSERNHFCPYCVVSGGDCELQNAAYAEGMTYWPIQPNFKPYEVDASHPYFILDQNRCILCRRCVRACGELVGNFTLGFEERGAESRLVADLGVPMGDSTCISCGTCIQVCPTGALIDRNSAYRGLETQVDHHETVCLGCSIGCGVDVLTRDNNLVRIEGNWEAPINKGIICKVGRFLPMEETRERIKSPMIRRNGTLQAASWDEAVDAIAVKIKSGSVAGIASTRLSAEALYQFKEMFKNATSLEENGIASVSSKLAEETKGAFESDLNAIHSADMVLMVGADLVNNHEVAGFFIKRNLPNGIKLVTIDAEANDFSYFADMALSIKSGVFLDTISGLASLVRDLKKAKDVEVDAEKSLPDFEAKTGISAKSALAVANLLQSAQRPVIVYGEGLAADASAVAALKALVDLAHVCGAVSGKDSSLVCLKGGANSLAAVQYGLDKAFALDGQQAVFVALGDDTPKQSLVKLLEKAPFLAVQASYVSPLTAQADVVLPVETWSETEGSYLNFAGCLQKAVRSQQMPQDVKSNIASLKAIADKMGVKVDAGKWEKELVKRTAPVSVVNA